MKKITLLGMVCLFLLSFVGCQGRQINLKAEETMSNTLLITRDKEAKVVYIEDFGQPYYNLDELKEYVTGQIDTFNNQGDGTIKLEDMLLRNGQAVMMLSFDSLGTYSQFSEDDAYLFSADQANEAEITLPDMFINAKDNSYVTKDIALEGKKLKVLVVNAPYDVIVNGRVKYYSQNATYKSKNSVQSAAEGMTVIIYK